MIAVSVFRGSIMLEDEIKRGESETLEFKESLPSDSKKYLKTIIAFANTSGGKLIIGVSDKDHQIKGIPEDKAYAICDVIADTISNSCLPFISASSFVQTINDKYVIVTEVYPGENRPYYLKSEGKAAGTYIRIDGITKAADPQIVQELEIEGSRKTFDRLKNVEVKVTDDAIETLCHDLSQYGKKKITLADLINSEILKERNGRLEATNAFALLTANNAFRFTTIKCARFKGCDTREFIDRKEFNTPLYKQIENAYNFVLNNINLSGKIEGLVRKDTYEVPPSAVREAILNAVIHRSYLLENRAIYLAVFDNRIEITSPGRLYGSMNLERIKAGLSVPRNAALARIFGLAGLVEGWGIGIKRIITECSEYGLKEPKFETIGTDFRVTIYRPSASGALNVNQLPENSAAGDLEQLVLEALTQDGRLTISELSEKFNVSLSTIKRTINSLKEKKMIVRKGNNRTGFWEVKKS